MDHLSPSHLSSTEGFDVWANLRHVRPTPARRRRQEKPSLRKSSKFSLSVSFHLPRRPEAMVVVWGGDGAKRNEGTRLSEACEWEGDAGKCSLFCVFFFAFYFSLRRRARRRYPPPSPEVERLEPEARRDTALLC
ncbi:unnamed protein product [Ixodes persulcatus]